MLYIIRTENIQSVIGKMKVSTFKLIYGVFLIFLHGLIN